MPSAIAKKLNRLSREKLIHLCVSWSKSSKCTPYLASNRSNVEVEDEDYLHEPARSRIELRTIYSKVTGDESEIHTLAKKDIVNRIVDGDWRRGLSHQQLADIDFAILEENESSLRWTAVKLVPLHEQDDNDAHFAKRRRISQDRSSSAHFHYPSSNATMFVQTLKKHISPLVKAHYHIYRLASLRLSIVRLYIQPDTPFAPLSANTPRQNRSAVDSARTMYIALPDSCPYVYISIAGTTNDKVVERNKGKQAVPNVDIAATKRIVLEAIPKALSRPQQRWSIEGTKLTARSLKTMALLRGGGTVGSTGGVVAPLTHDELTTNREVDITSKKEIEDDLDEVPQRQHKDQVNRAFGDCAGANHAKLDKIQLHVKDLLSDSSISKRKRKSFYDEDADTQAAPITITLSGNDVFAGMKVFALQYPEYVDLAKLPSALTGANGTTQIVI